MTAGVLKKTPLCEPCSKWCVLVPENAVYVFTEGIKQTYADTASSPVARDHWEIFELIIKESGDKGSDGKGRKSEAPGKSWFQDGGASNGGFPASSPVARDHWEIFELIIKESARSHHPSLALLACSRVPLSPLSLGKACGGGRCGYVWKGLTNLHPRVLLLGRENLGTRLGPYLPDISSDAKITSQIFLAVWTTYFCLHGVKLSKVVPLFLK